VPRGCGTPSNSIAKHIKTRQIKAEQLSGKAMASSAPLFAYEPEDLIEEHPFVEDEDEFIETGESSFSGIPKEVDDFLKRLHTGLVDQSVVAVGDQWDAFPKLSNTFFRSKRWPSAEEAKAYYQKRSPGSNIYDDQAFLWFYNELYYRHLHYRLPGQVTARDRQESWKNYGHLFSYLEEQKDEIMLPEQWLFGMVDEFIYQFGQYADSVTSAAPGSDLRGLPCDSWTAIGVINRLGSLIRASGIRTTLLEDRVNSKDGQENDPLSFDGMTCLDILGYFSLVGLLRLNVMLGDYHTALRSLDCIDFHRKAPLFAKVDGSHYSVYFHMAFSLMMVRRFGDAVRMLSAYLSFAARNQKVQRGKEEEKNEMQRRADKMFLLLALCSALCNVQPDDSVKHLMETSLGAKLAHLQKGELEAFKESFLTVCPKVVVPNEGSPSAPSWVDGTVQQLRIFINEVEVQSRLPELRSFLKLYTTVHISKLASCLNVDAPTVRG
jgi:translation initiation factor 3 subunit L